MAVVTHLIMGDPTPAYWERRRNPGAPLHLKTGYERAAEGTLFARNDRQPRVRNRPLSNYERDAARQAYVADIRARCAAANLNYVQLADILNAQGYIIEYPRVKDAVSGRYQPRRADLFDQINRVLAARGFPPAGDA